MIILSKTLIISKKISLNVFGIILLHSFKSLQNNIFEKKMYFLSFF